MTNKYRLRVPQLGLPAGTEFERQEFSRIFWTINSKRVGVNYELVRDNPNIFEPMIERWKPAMAEQYWYVGTDIRETEDCNGEYLFDKQRLEVGNCFQTKDQAEEAAKRIKNTLMSYHEELATNEEAA